MSSKRGVRRRACEGKVRHESSEDATKALARVRKVGSAVGPMNVYGCNFCGGWHIGHRPGSARKRRATRFGPRRNS